MWKDGLAEAEKSRARGHSRRACRGARDPRPRRGIGRGDAVAKLPDKLDADQKTQETSRRANELVGARQGGGRSGDLDGAANLLKEAEGSRVHREPVVAARRAVERSRAPPTASYTSDLRRGRARDIST